MRNRVDALLYGLLALALIAVCVLRANCEKQLYNFRVTKECLTEVVLIGCDDPYHPRHCQTTKVRYHSDTCLELVAQ